MLACGVDHYQCQLCFENNFNCQPIMKSTNFRLTIIIKPFESKLRNMYFWLYIVVHKKRATFIFWIAPCSMGQFNPFMPTIPYMGHLI